jgi:hypothetical protein
MTAFFGSQIVRLSHTMQEAVFARLITSATFDGSQVELLFGRWGGWAADKIVLSCERPKAADGVPLAGILYEVSKDYSTPFSVLPIDYLAMANRDRELIDPLQDLGQVIALEASAAFRAEYYPGVPDVDALSDDHVAAVMMAMQREMEREGSSRHKSVTKYTELPFERQRALAERRRHWYGKFGITPATWRSGVFSLWDVANEPLPEIMEGKPA